MSERAGAPPEAAYVACLAELPAMWSTRLAALLGLARTQDVSPGHCRSAQDVWRLIVSGHPPFDERGLRRCQPDPKGLARDWQAAARGVSVEHRWQAYLAAGVGVWLLGERGYPSCLADDHRAPYFLYSLGDPRVLHGPRVAIVGTRRSTPSGREIALEFGRELASAGVRVVSGLALGIDGAAHAGVLAAAGGAPPVGVVAGGLDRPYPTRHRALWRQVAAAGVLLSEAPLGTPNDAWRFPSRNQIIAALADVVVVVESHSSGGSMITAEEALKRGRTVLAVPGPVRSPASAGTNQLFREGAGPACDTTDILAAVALHHAGEPPLTLSAPTISGSSAPATPEPVPPALAVVLEAVDWSPTSTQQVLARTGLALGPVSAALARLEMGGWVRAQGGWWERTGAPKRIEVRPTLAE